MRHFKKFNNYEEYKAAQSGLDTPTLSLCMDEKKILYNPETKVVAKFDVTDTTHPTKICYNEYISGFSSIEIDGDIQPTVESSYTFNTLGEHIIRYTLKDPTKISDYAFYNCSNIIVIHIPDNVTTIGENAFYYCHKLRILIMSENLIEIKENAFKYCASLTDITIPKNVINIENCAFENCLNLVSINSLSQTAPEIKPNTFKNVKSNGTLYVPKKSTGYESWFKKSDNFLGNYNWITKHIK